MVRVFLFGAAAGVLICNLVYMYVLWMDRRREEAVRDAIDRMTFPRSLGKLSLRADQ